MLGLKTSLDRYKKIDVTLCILSDHYGRKAGDQQKQKQKVYELMETKQLSTEWKKWVDRNK